MCMCSHACMTTDVEGRKNLQNLFSPASAQDPGAESELSDLHTIASTH